MTGGIIAIGAAAVIMLNQKRVVAKLRRSNIFPWVLVFAVFSLVSWATQSLLQGGR